MTLLYSTHGDTAPAPPRTSRRAFLSTFLAPWRTAGTQPPAATALTPSSPPTSAPEVAVVQGRFCLAYQQSFCSTCVERCPIPGAIVLEQGRPRIDPALCNGCRLCHDVCPAPRTAILMLPRSKAARLVHPPQRSKSSVESRNHLSA